MDKRYMINGEMFSLNQMISANAEDESFSIAELAAMEPGDVRESLHAERVECVLSISTQGESTQVYKVRMACGHIEDRRMRPATAGVPWSPEVIIDTPRAECKVCRSVKGVT